MNYCNKHIQQTILGMRRFGTTEPSLRAANEAHKRFGMGGSSYPTIEIEIEYHSEVYSTETPAFALVWTSERPDDIYDAPQVPLEGKVDKKVVRLRLSGKSKYPADARVWVAAFVDMKTQGERGVHISEAGVGGVLLRSLFDTPSGVSTKLVRPAMRDERVEHRLDLEKGWVVIRLLKAPDTTFDGVVFEDAHPNNLAHQSDLMMREIDRMVELFDPNYLSAKGERMPTLQKDLYRVSVDNVGTPLGQMPGYFYFGMHQMTMVDEGSILHFLDIALARRGWNVTRFIDAAVMWRSGAAPDNNMRGALAVVSEVMTCMATSLHYETDYAAVRRAGGRIGNMVVECFGDVLRRLSGDCEDFAWLILAVIKWIREGYRGSNKAMLEIKHILGHYIPCGTLLLCSGAKQGDADHLNLRLDDPKLVPGAHMCVSLIPRDYMLEIVARANPGVTELPREMEAPGFSPSPRDTDSRYPVMALEGTGRLNPLLLGASEYYGQNAQKFIESFENAQKAIESNSPAWKSVTVERINLALRSERMASPNNFYLAPVCIFPAFAGKLEVSVEGGQKRTLRVMRALCRRDAYGQSAERAGSTNGWIYGAPYMDFLGRSKEIGALATLAPNNEFWATYRRWVRHLPPNLPISSNVSDEFKNRARAIFTDVVANFRKELGLRYTDSAISAADSHGGVLVTYVHPLEKFSPKLVRELAMSAAKAKGLVSANLRLDVLHEGVASVTMTFRIMIRE